MKSKTSGTYQVMPKVDTEHTSQMDQSFKGKEESRLFPCAITRDKNFSCVPIGLRATVY